MSTIAASLVCAANAVQSVPFEREPIEGYAIESSVTQGERVSLAISSQAPRVDIEVRRIGTVLDSRENYFFVAGVAARPQSIDDTVVSRGCRWSETFGFRRVETGRVDSMPREPKARVVGFARNTTEGDWSEVTFVVRPEALREALPHLAVQARLQVESSVDPTWIDAIEVRADPAN